MRAMTWLAENCCEWHANCDMDCQVAEKKALFENSSEMNVKSAEQYRGSDCKSSPTHCIRAEKERVAHLRVWTSHGKQKRVQGEMKEVDGFELCMKVKGEKVVHYKPNDRVAH